MMRRKKTWLLVADEAIARALEWSDGCTGLRSVEELTDPRAHAKEGEDQQHPEAEAFAGRIAERMSEGLRLKRFEALEVVAPPRLPGHLRNAFSPQVTASVVRETNEDLLNLENDDLARRLSAVD